MLHTAVQIVFFCAGVALLFYAGGFYHALIFDKVERDYESWQRAGRPGRFLWCRLWACVQRDTLWKHGGESHSIVYCPACRKARKWWIEDRCMLPHDPVPYVVRDLTKAQEAEFWNWLDQRPQPITNRNLIWPLLSAPRLAPPPTLPPTASRALEPRGQ